MFNIHRLVFMISLIFSLSVANADSTIGFQNNTEFSNDAEFADDFDNEDKSVGSADKPSEENDDFASPKEDEFE